MTISDHQSGYLDELFARLDDVLGDLAELSRVTLPAEQLNAVLLRETKLVTQAQGLQARSMQAAEDAALSVRYGTRLLTTHLAKHTLQPARALGSARSLADWLIGFPMLHDALINGRISRSHVVELRKIDNNRTNHLLIRDQAFFVDAAESVVFTDWMNLVAYWLNAADPDGELTDPDDPSYGMTVELCEPHLAGEEPRRPPAIDGSRVAT